MPNWIKRILGIGITKEEQKVLDTIEESGLKTRRVGDRGSLSVDSKEVRGSEKFKEYVEKARKVVLHEKEEKEDEADR